MRQLPQTKTVEHHKKNHRPKLVNKLADAVNKELMSHRTSNSFVTDKFEQIKSKLRFRFTTDEIRDLCLCMATAVVDANAICEVKGKRPTITSKINFQPFLKDKGQ